MAAQTPEPPQNPVNQARALWATGDAKRLKSDYKGARKAYEEAAASLRTTKLTRWAEVTKMMMDLCDRLPVQLTGITPGKYTGTAPGYSGDVTVSVEVSAGKIQAVEVTTQKESRPFASLTQIPQSIKTGQSPSVDAVTGATVTSYAIMVATGKALEQGMPARGAHDPR